MRAAGLLWPAASEGSRREADLPLVVGESHRVDPVWPRLGECGSFQGPLGLPWGLPRLPEPVRLLAFRLSCQFVGASVQHNADVFLHPPLSESFQAVAHESRPLRPTAASACPRPAPFNADRRHRSSPLGPLARRSHRRAPEGQPSMRSRLGPPATRPRSCQTRQVEAASRRGRRRRQGSASRCPLLTRAGSRDGWAQVASNGPTPESVTTVASSDGGLIRATAASP